MGVAYIVDLIQSLSGADGRALVKTIRNDDISSLDEHVPKRDDLLDVAPPHRRLLRRARLRVVDVVAPPEAPEEGLRLRDHRAAAAGDDDSEHETHTTRPTRLPHASGGFRERPRASAGR
jgi:hypothetical protein